MITFQGSYRDVDASIHSLSYSAGSMSGADAIHYDIWNQAGVETTGDVSVTIGGGGGGGVGGGPAVQEPANETVAAGGTQSISGSYADAFAQGNPGMLFLSITDTSGMLAATDADGNAVAGSGSHGIGLNVDFVDLNAVLSSRSYTAGADAGSDTIRFDVWNQAGTETTAATGVTVSAAAAAADAQSFSAALHQASTDMLADFGTGSSAGVSGGSSLSDPNAGSRVGSVTPADDFGQPIGVPFTLGQ